LEKPIHPADEQLGIRNRFYLCPSVVSLLLISRNFRVEAEWPDPFQLSPSGNLSRDLTVAATLSTG